MTEIKRNLLLGRQRSKSNEHRRSSRKQTRERLSPLSSVQRAMHSALNQKRIVGRVPDVRRRWQNLNEGSQRTQGKADVFMNKPSSTGVEQGLLPCPFCGADGVITETHRSHFVVICASPHCAIRGMPEASPLAAATVWNERVPLTSSQTTESVEPRVSNPNPSTDTSRQPKTFLGKLRDAHEKTGKSKLHFGAGSLAQEDTERLDAVEKGGLDVWPCMEGWKCGNMDCPENTGTGKTVREAIDAAMADAARGSTPKD